MTATRIIVHAGFHKTGTTSLQDFLRANGDALAPHFRYYGKADFLAAGARARIYGQRRLRWNLWRFARSLRRFLGGVTPGGTIVLSRETFSGAMPGHRDLLRRPVLGYVGHGAPALAHTIVAELRRRFGADCEIVFFYTLRDRDPWLASVHGHLLRSIRLTDDFARFAGRFPPDLCPEAEASAMAAFLAPIEVITARLEDHANRREGPAGALLDHLGIPDELRARLRPARRANSGQSAELRQRMLELNRGNLSKPALKRAKEALLSRKPGPQP